MGIDLRLTGAMIVIAYCVYVFVGQSLSPIATSRRRVRRVQLWYARSVALVLILASLVSLAVPIGSLKEGIMLSLTSAILPLAAISLFFSALVIKRLYERRLERSQFKDARPAAMAPLSLAELESRGEGHLATDDPQEEESGFDAELAAMDEQLEQDLGEYRDLPDDPDADQKAPRPLQTKPGHQRRA